MATETTYRLIGFGHYGNTEASGFFNQPRFILNRQTAYVEYQAMLADPSFDGAVLIEVNHEDWRVIEEFGTENKSIVYGPLGNFKVEKAPKIVFA